MPKGSILWEAAADEVPEEAGVFGRARKWPIGGCVRVTRQERRFCLCYKSVSNSDPMRTNHFDGLRRRSAPKSAAE
jgi:hypothetical protein